MIKITQLQAKCIMVIELLSVVALFAMVFMGGK